MSDDQKKSALADYLRRRRSSDDDNPACPVWPDPDPEGRERRERRWSRRSKAARERRHLPDLAELILHMSFFGNDLAADVQTWAERVYPLIPEDDREDHTALRHHLTILTVSASLDDLRDTAEAFRRAGKLKRINKAVAALRLDYYSACLGDRHAPWRIAGEAISRAYDLQTPQDQALDYATAAVGWLIHAGRYEPLSADRLAGQRSRPRMDFRGDTSDFGLEVLARMLDERERRIYRRVETYFKTRTEPNRDGASPTGDAEEAGGEEPRPEDPGAVVFRSVGNVETSQRVAREFAELLNTRLRLAHKPDLAVLQKTLTDEFPQAAEIVSAILSELVPLDIVRLRPILLVGEPGAGKTRFAERLCDALALPHETYSCGGVSDAALGGTARRWMSAEPSLPVSLIRQFRHASPGIILDEIEKVGTSRHNGNPLDALLPMLEPLSATHWHDPYLQAHVDLSHVVWIATANELRSLPGPLRDRFRVFHFPEPGPEHLLPLAGRLMQDIVQERGLDPRWAIPLDGEELAALQAAWPGGSVRILRRLVERLLLARDRWKAEEEVQ
ncbi:AAA family ATPase [Afifella sp. H1R]|uniref:AAA family ATPase n=1 Tax=Afifella sp. H1R TaxID=2908841 RepID=UPI001F433EC5|nr:AAA family ATPase [Afifella sp. H1R]MCF1504029.1 AAA family ATPase [Afifella sp. H1R]